MSVLRFSNIYTSEMIERSETMPDVIKKAFDRLRISKWHPDVRKEYLVEHLDLKNCKDVLKAAGAEGWAAGWAKGLAEGRAEGLAEEGRSVARMAMVKPLVSQSVPDETIPRTGVTKEGLASAKDAAVKTVAHNAQLPSC